MTHYFTHPVNQSIALNLYGFSVNVFETSISILTSAAGLLSSFLLPYFFIDTLR